MRLVGLIVIFNIESNDEYWEYDKKIIEDNCGWSQDEIIPRNQPQQMNEIHTHKCAYGGKFLKGNDNSFEPKATTSWLHINKRIVIQMLFAKHST